MPVLVAGFVVGLLLAAGVAAFWIHLSTREPDDAALIEQWEDATASGRPIAEVIEVAARDAQGSQAWVRWVSDGLEEDAWLDGLWPVPGTMLVLADHDLATYGGLGGRTDVVLICPVDVVDILPPGIRLVHERHLNRQAARALNRAGRAGRPANRAVRGRHAESPAARTRRAELPPVKAWRAQARHAEEQRAQTRAASGRRRAYLGRGSLPA